MPGFTSRSEGFHWTGYSIPFINHGWWMMDRWWRMMEDGLMADGGWLMMDEDSWLMMDDPSSAMHHPSWVIHQWSIISHPPSIINDSSAVIFTWKRSSSWYLFHNPFEFCNHPRPHSNLFRCFEEKRPRPENATTNCYWLARIPDELPLISAMSCLEGVRTQSRSLTRVLKNKSIKQTCKTC